MNASTDAADGLPRLTWLGCATFLLEIGAVRLLLDAYVDRVPAAPPVGQRAQDIGELNVILLGHSHPHHMADAPRIARQTGARIICHPVAAEVLSAHGVPERQLSRAAGGERYSVAPGVTVRVFPSLHACDWAPAGQSPSFLVGLDEDARAGLDAAGKRTAELLGVGSEEANAMGAHLADLPGTAWHGGVLAYLVEWPGGSLLFQDSIGAWSGTLNDLRPDVAILSAAGVPNLNGDPFEGSVDEFVLFEAALLGWPLVVPCHHDNWMPPFTSEHGRDATLAEVFRAVGQDPPVRLAYSEGLSLARSRRRAGNDSGMPGSCPVCGKQVRMLYHSNDSDGAHTRLFCVTCAELPEFKSRIAAGQAHLVSIPDLGRWAANRMLAHGASNEARRPR